MKTFVIGDIHGRCAQLYGLLEMLPRDPSTDTLVFLGESDLPARQPRTDAFGFYRCGQPDLDVYGDRE